MEKDKTCNKMSRQRDGQKDSQNGSQEMAREEEDRRGRWSDDITTYINTAAWESIAQDITKMEIAWQPRNGKKRRGRQAYLLDWSRLYPIKPTDRLQPCHPRDFIGYIVPKICSHASRLTHECNATTLAHTSAIQISLEILRVDTQGQS